MNGIEASDVLRIAVISGLIGFGVFCVSFSMSVWFRRNRARPNRAARFSFLALTLGVFGVAGNWAYNEFSSRNGIVGGQDLFVVHAKRNVTIDNLAQGRVEKGERLAEFLPPSLDGQLAVIDSHIKQAQSKIDFFDMRALPVDTTLPQRRLQLRQQIDQAAAMALDIQKSRREVERALLETRTQYAEKLSQNDARVAAEKQEVATATSQIEVAQSAVQRTADSRKSGVGTVVAVEEKTATYLSQILARNKAQSNLASLRTYREVLVENYDRALASLGLQLSALDVELAANRQAVKRLKEETIDTDRAIGDDRSRAAEATVRERQAAVHELEALKAERVGLLAATRVNAPFAGEVVYRHPAPGFAPENTPVLALSAGHGFVARVWVPTREIEAIKAAGRVQLALEQPILNKFFEGEYRSFEEAPYEKDRVIAHFDAKLPLEAITLLAGAGNPVQVKLLWRPNLLDSYTVRGSLSLIALGCVGAVASGLRRKPEEAAPAPRIEADVLEARLREVARGFHTLLRQGRLDDDPDLVSGALRLVERMGEPALKVFREEIVFDDELERAIAGWNGHNQNPALTRLLNELRGPVVISHAV